MLKMRVYAFLILACALLLGSVVALPLEAQTATPTPDPNSLVLVTGPVDLSSGDIVVAGYVIAPAGAFIPAVLQQGDVVIVTGYLLPDGITIQVITIELFIEPEVTPEVTPEITPEVTLEVTPEMTPEVTLEVTPEITPEVTPTVEPTQFVCNVPNHPVAMRIAEAFNVPYETVIAQHCAGFGFGEITRAYLIGEQTGEDPQFYLDLRNQGAGWGQIVRETGIHPSELAPGQVHRGGYNPDPTATPEGDSGEAAPETAPTAVPGASGNRGNNGNGNGNGNSGRPNCPGNSCNAPGNSGNNGNGPGGGNGNNGRGNGGNGGGRGNGRP